MLNKDRLNEALTLLNNRLELSDSEPVNLVVCGGSALIIIDAVKRITKDVDVLGTIKDKKEIIEFAPVPETLKEAVSQVARDLGIEENWLNTGPKDLLKYGLPEGCIERLQERKYGRLLTVYFVSRFDQIHFKVYAAVDSGPGRHVDDLLALKPTEEEMEKAARWAMTHDASEGFQAILKEMLRKLKYERVAERI